MATDAVNNVAATGLPFAPDRTASDRQEVKRLAEQFEAMLMTQMLREMRRSMLDDEDQQEGFGADALTDTGDIEFGSAMSRSGGLGVADQMLKVFERQIEALMESGTIQAGATSAPATSSSDATHAAAMAAATLKHLAISPAVDRVGDASPSALDPGDITGTVPVSSGFGWRRDPMTGTARFHQGVDLAVAYGQNVKAAAEGVVSFSGEQQGYGNTVVINHGDGRQTRYGHLSEPLVRAGEAIDEGQVVGRSGNSGRSTGAHLHFEMLVNGRAVDPFTTTTQ